MNPILEQFLVEARENLLYLDKNLSSLEGSDKDTVNALFRAAHTLKGSSGLSGFDAVKEVTHIAEDLLDAYRNDKITYSDTLLDALYDMFDEVTELVDATEESGEVASVGEDKILEFKKLREEILDLKEEVIEGIDTELNIIDDEVPFFANMFKNDFSSIELNTIPYEPQEITQESFTNMNYYFIDIDLDEDTLQMGNDPFYALYLLENENIISIHTEVSATLEQIKEDPLQWSSRITAIVYSNQELLEDAFYNFLEDVSVYPLSVKSLLNCELEIQTNDSIIDFLDDIKNLPAEFDYKNIVANLKAVVDILNPNSLQGFLFGRLRYLIEDCNLDEKLIPKALNYILELINDENIIEDEIEEEIQSLEEPEQETEEDTIEIDNIQKEEISEEVISEVVSLDEDDKKTIADILSEQNYILNNIDNENVHTQIKSVLLKLEKSLGDHFGIENCNDKDDLLRVIENMFDSIGCKDIVEEKIEVENDAPEPEKVIERKSESEISQNKNEVTKKTKKESKKEKNQKVAKQVAKTVKIDLSDIDSMMDIVGEMLVIKNALPYIADGLDISNVESSKRDLQTRYDEINRVTTLLQEKVMQMRLLSVSFIFDRYPKLVRDISKSLNKKIKYHEEGGETKLDKTIIEKLADPLIHIIRNSLDHGIETPEEREENGKDPEGNISISAQSLGDKVYITIEDDGRGIDVDKVVHKALDKKMVDPDQLDEMSREEKLMLVFHPGVSTMEKISELSGRGVGMDVVRQSIDDVGGKISLKSEVGVGTTLVLELPMSVALTNVFHVKLGDVNYALAMDTISETVQIPKEEIEYVNKKPMLKLRGNLIPLIFNYNLLSKDVDQKENISLLIIETSENKFGYVVDEFVNQLDIIQKPLSSNFKDHPFISGTSLLGNGEVLFVINPVKLINQKEKK
ncbi:MAG: chemotaxis protein CheA [Campylobacterota bacterium]|nr:chemotaxis protein CheA [Campylobacterota bacterium]